MNNEVFREMINSPQNLKSPLQNFSYLRKIIGFSLAKYCYALLACFLVWRSLQQRPMSWGGLLTQGREKVHELPLPLQEEGREIGSG